MKNYSIIQFGFGLHNSNNLMGQGAVG